MAKVPDTEENLKKCLCGGCPTYNECMKGKMEGIFCARAKSDCDLTKDGCLCGACPLTSQYGLNEMYYCETGAAV
jgi:hypothetical protein